jgi:hypothetical protein
MSEVIYGYISIPVQPCADCGGETSEVNDLSRICEICGCEPINMIRPQGRALYQERLREYSNPRFNSAEEFLKAQREWRFKEEMDNYQIAVMQGVHPDDLF